ncbi:hypothetical protein [Pelomonas sp. Root1444]|uniref:hypothetical protein n=1 Tax=Pelomonas sp. Root1444 TaxID=1736464 RepID=UPI00070244F1|nr:hypothetical protein [Pelomonas sp. Root1444]KQY88219.1 hypothetical protein ASD35_11505 [Pelomonas sp. Root1444]
MLPLNGAAALCGMVGDLTPYAADYPHCSFDAPRPMPALATEAGYDGVTYLSAQRHGAVC